MSTSATMSAGLGRVKTPTPAARVETFRRIARHKSQIMLRACNSILCWRISFSTFRKCMSFHTARVISDIGLFPPCPFLPCAVKRRRFPVGENPTRQPLQPEATGAVMEVTKWLKPLVSVSRIGDSASVQAVTRVNAEQASKRTMRRPTRRPFRGRLIRLG